MENQPALSDITALILAGGQGARMGGLDKGLQELRGQPLVAWAIDRLAPQTGALMISANRNAERYAGFGYPVIADNPHVAQGDFQGPLAGIQAGLQQLRTPWLLTAPCDVPELPVDLARRLFAAVQSEGCQIALVIAAGRRQPVIALLHRDLLPSLEAYLATGRRSVYGWQQGLPHVEVEFADCSFANLNSPDDLLACNERLPDRLE
ncbi:MAG: molybdenum cofactor guanylyltransferase MobA [Azonexus sp.]